MLNNPTVLRTRTTLTSNNTRVNWRNVSYFKLEKTDTCYNIGIKWKFKASIQTENIEINIENNPYRYFKAYGLVQLGPDTFINLARILTINEEQVHGAIENTRIRITFMDGFRFQVKIPSTDWVWWKTTYM